MRDDDLIETESRAVGQRVREEIARRRLSRQALADMARISLSTLEKALAGTRPFTLATTLRIEAALDLMLRPSAAATIAPAPDTAPKLGRSVR
jgi:transcriptional regulator with XRE-family HTH domain